jgi:AraC-like DNA-binding protein
MKGRAAEEERSAGALAPWRVRRALKLLLAETGESCTVETLATACGLSRSRFAQAFKVSIGVPPHRWLVLHRIEIAREMMERTTERLSTIAASCGFADQSHLTRAFHAAMGCSPAVWRRARKSAVAATGFEAGKSPAPEMDDTVDIALRIGAD